MKLELIMSLLGRMMDIITRFSQRMNNMDYTLYSNFYHSDIVIVTRVLDNYYIQAKNKLFL